MRNFSSYYKFALFFSAIELFVFILIYVAHSLFLRDFPIDASLRSGLYAFLWRIISLQIFLQIFFLFVLLKFKIIKYVLILISVWLTVPISSYLSFSDFSIEKTMFFPTKELIGEGFAITVSAVLAMVIFRIFFPKQWSAL